jgi:hypothetical protein
MPYRTRKGGRASGHDDDKAYQVVHVGDPPHSTLVKGEYKIPQSPIHMLKTDYAASGSGMMHDSSDKGYHLKGSYNNFRMPRIDFPKFDGEHPRLWKKNVRNIS